jgi:hypothetical protein
MKQWVIEAAIQLQVRFRTAVESSIRLQMIAIAHVHKTQNEVLAENFKNNNLNLTCSF